MRKLLVLLLAVNTLIGCSKDDAPPKIAINQTEVKLKFDKDFDFKIENATNIKWSASDNFVGAIDANGKFKANHIGEATVTGEFDGKTLTAKVIVEPYITDITEPYKSFGSTREQIKSFEKRIFKSEGTAGMIFNGQGTKEKEVWYSIENLKYNSSLITFRTTSTTIADDIAKFYSERYNFGGNEDDILIFESKDKKYAVGIAEFEELGLGAMYIVGNSQKASMKNAISLQQLRVEKSNVVDKIGHYLSK